MIMIVDIRGTNLIHALDRTKDVVVMLGRRTIGIEVTANQFA